MKTKFILHGGRLRLKDERNDAYFRELTKDLRDGDEVLFIGFARRDEKDRAEVYEREKKFILAQTTSDVQVVNATHDNLIEQIKSAKAVQITGGESPDLIRDLKHYPDFLQALAGRVVGGSSAGACLFSAYFFNTDETGVLEGLGTLPIRLKVHYGSPGFGDIATSLKLLDECPGDLELVLLKECEWIVKEADYEISIRWV